MREQNFTGQCLMLLQPDDNNSYSFKMEFDEGGLVSN